jgi:flavin-dependent dehydrogenase
MEHCDVLIVGGGPAGSTLAWKLKKSGLDILVLDKSVFPRDKVCAGWITPQTAKLLDLNTDDYSRQLVLQGITGFRTGLIGGDGVVTRYDGTVSYGIRRCEFDHYLLLRSTARLRLGEPLRSMERKSSNWIINGDVKAPLVIGAGGHFCPVARFLRGNRAGTGPVVIAQEVEFELNDVQQQECRVQADTPELYFCDDLKGYGWCVRKGNFLNIGLGREGSGNIGAQVRSFMGHLREKKRIPANTPADFKGHAYKLYSAALQTWVGDGVLLVGDAAGLAYPKSGEGIRPAVESALTAAEVILAAAGDYHHNTLERYPALLAGRSRKDNSARDFLPQPVKRLLGRSLMESSWFSRHVLLDRWFLRSSPVHGKAD